MAGSQGTQTEYLMDGADNTDSFSNVNLPFPFPDALQEFSVQTSGLCRTVRLSSRLSCEHRDADGSQCLPRHCF